MQVTQYELSHGRSVYQDICAPMTQQFCGGMKDKTISLHPDMGTGYFRYVSPCKDLEMYISDVTFHQRVVLREQTYRESFSICFCFSDMLEWAGSSESQHVLLEKGDCCVYENGSFEMENFYEEGQRYIGIGLNLHPGRFGAVTDCLLERKAVSSAGESPALVRKYRITKSVEIILRQILGCNYIDSLKSLYLEGKILELASAFANEVVLEKDLIAVGRDLNMADSTTLAGIRTLLDENFSEPLTIAELARKSFMSESRLRQMFRQQYGITIYQYVLNCRMEKARELIESGNYQVKDAAGMVGYSNISHFSEAFRKKFGYTPSQYKRIWMQ